MNAFRLLVTGAALVFGLVAAPALSTPVLAQAVTDEWSTVRVPEAPEVKAVTVDPKTTALLVMDFHSTRCTVQNRPRCPVALPRIAKLLAAARDHKLTVVHTMNGTDAADLAPLVAPLATETVLARTGPDKFLAPGADLQKILKDKGITTVIMVGTSANGAVLQTATEGTFRGFKVIVAVDGMPGESAFTEAFTAWDLAHGPTVSANATLTKTDLISFAP
jgi:nicotinamidase-related amidase